jgi:hypothetical protein
MTGLEDFRQNKTSFEFCPCFSIKPTSRQPTAETPGPYRSSRLRTRHFLTLPSSRVKSKYQRWWVQELKQFPLKWSITEKKERCEHKTMDSKQPPLKRFRTIEYWPKCFRNGHPQPVVFKRDMITVVERLSHRSNMVKDKQVIVLTTFLRVMTKNLYLNSSGHTTFFFCPSYPFCFDWSNHPNEINDIHVSTNKRHTRFYKCQASWEVNSSEVRTKK